MTRDEHIKIEMDRLMAGPALCGQHPGIVREMAESNVNCFVRHGILKLDEPKTIEQRLDAAVRENLYRESAYSRDAVYINPGYLMAIIAHAGLRIVEK